MKKRIMCFGDSNTWGYIPKLGIRYAENVRYTGILAKGLGDKCVIIEEGLNGRTTAFSDKIEPERCALDHITPILLSHLPLDYIVIMLGTNDTKTHFNVNSIEIGYGMEELLFKIMNTIQRKKQNTKIIIVAPPPINPINEPMFDENASYKSKKLVEIYKQLANQYSYFFLEAGSVINELGEDGIHLTEKGHKELGDALVKLIKDIEKEGK